MFRLPARQKAHVALRGLRVEEGHPVFGGRTFAWAQVCGLTSEYGTAGWQVCEEDGQLLQSDGRPLLLTLSTAHANRLAWRAQERSIRQTWRGGTLRFSEEFSKSRFGAWLGVAFAVGFIAWTLIETGPGLLRAWRGEINVPLDPAYSILVKCVVVGFMTFFFVPALMLWVCIAKLMANPVVRITLDAEGVRAMYLDGQETTGYWRELAATGRSLSGTWMRFRDGTQIRFDGASARLRLIVRAIERELLPELVEGRRLGRRRALVRAGAIWVLGCAGIAGVSEHLARGHSPVSHPGLSVFLVLIAFTVCFLAMAAMAEYGPSYVARRLRGRRRRTLRQSANDQPPASDGA